MYQAKIIISHSNGNNSSDTDRVLSVDAIVEKASNNYAKAVAIVVPESYRFIAGEVVNAFRKNYVPLGIVVDETMQNEEWALIIMEK